jgi:hypothetical protein
MTSAARRRYPEGLAWMPSPASKCRLVAVECQSTSDTLSAERPNALIAVLKGRAPG